MKPQPSTIAPRLTPKQPSADIINRTNILNNLSRVNVLNRSKRFSSIPKGRITPVYKPAMPMRMKSGGAINQNEAKMMKKSMPKSIDELRTRVQKAKGVTPLIKKVYNTIPGVKK